MSAFVDTSAFYAASDHGDQAHARANELLVAERSLVTTDHVLVETWLLINARGGHEAAERFWGGLQGAGIGVEVVTPGDLEAAWAIGDRFGDQSFSIVDRTSFAVMERLGVHRAVAFDDDFAVYRFGARRERAFEVLR